MCLKNIFLWLLGVCLMLPACKQETPTLAFFPIQIPEPPIVKGDWYVVEEDVLMEDYLDFMDSLSVQHAGIAADTMTEHWIAWANPWMIDSLAATDYYALKDKGVICKDLLALPLLQAGDSLLIPNQAYIDAIQMALQQIRLDLNIPEYKLRVWQEDSLLATFPVRVGRNDERYLSMAGTVVDLRTHRGEGYIYRVNRHPTFINPKDNKPYEVTRRDDGVVTELPNVPWLEPIINGHRYGQLIHPTTNPRTLGKAYSNGCVGVGEGDAWRIYYYAPVGTPVKFRYDLKPVTSEGDTLQLKDIYPNYPARKKKPPQQVVAGGGGGGRAKITETDTCICQPGQ
jgi:L,D-transpeptidase ErfK/SrfK